MTSREDTSQAGPKNPRRDLYILINGMFGQIYGNIPTMVENVPPLDLDESASVVEYLWGHMKTDPSIPEEVKQETERDYKLCLTLYDNYRNTPANNFRSFLNTYRPERTRIEKLMRQLVGESA